MVLGDLGAEVIRVDPPGGPRWDHPANAMLQRGKRSIALDLKAAADLEIARQLIATADVVIENYRPGVADRLGIGHAAALATNPRLIYCSIPGYGHDDPRADVAAWESVIAADVSLLPPRDDDPNPLERRFTSLPMVSSFGAMVALHSVLAALIARTRSGRGQWVEAPLFDAAFELLGGGAQKVGDSEPQLQGTAAPTGMPQIGHYRCSDDRWIQLCLVQPRHLDWFVSSFLPERRSDGWGDSSRIMADPEIQGAMRARLTTLMAERPAAEWERLINEESGAPTALAQTTEDWLVRDEHARQVRSVIQLDDPELGSTAQAGYAFDLSSTPLEARSARHPLDSDREAIVADLATWETQTAPAPPAEGPQSGRALEGVKIVDVSQVLAGPTVGRLLAEYGAEVVKINSFEDRQHWMHLYTNGGKDSILVNLKTPEGMSLLGRLLEDADVFVENFTRGVAERLGFGDEAVREMHPQIIRVGVSAFGHTGNRGGYRGREELGQALTGIQTRWYGTDSPRMVFLALNDYGAGNWGAVGTLAALYHRLNTGVAQRVHTSLSHTATFHQLPYMIAFDGREWDEPTGQQDAGWNAFDRIYRASDRWFVVSAHGDQALTLLSIAGVVAGADLEQRLEEAFAKLPAEVWVARLRGTGIGAAVARTQEEVMEDPVTRARGLSLVRTLPTGETIRTVGPSPRLSATPAAAARLARPPGSDLDAVLQRLELGDDLDRLVEVGAVLEELPEGVEFVGRFRPAVAPAP